MGKEVTCECGGRGTAWGFGRYRLAKSRGGGEAQIASYVDVFAREAGFNSRIIETACGRCNVLVTVDAGGLGVLRSQATWTLSR